MGDAVEVHGLERTPWREIEWVGESPDLVTRARGQGLTGRQCMRVPNRGSWNEAQAVNQTLAPSRCSRIAFCACNRFSA